MLDIFKKINRRKAQTITTDFSYSLILFLFAIFIGFTIYHNINERNLINKEITDINDEINYISNKLMKTKGVPENWNTTNVNDVGWMSNYPELNITKLNYTFYLSYQDLKNYLKLDYDFQINVTYVNGTLLNINGNTMSFGTNMDSSTSMVTHLERIGYIVLNDKRVPVKVDIVLWDNKVI